MTSRQDRYRGALVGLAAGDAVGTTVEFKPPGSFPTVTDMTGGGPFSLPVGAWTDDTSMALCLADSLLAQRAFDPIDQLERYRRWYRDGERSSTGRCFDIGNATRAAIERFERSGEPYPGDADFDAAGNGPLMKLVPVPLAYARNPWLAREAAALSARTTHGAPAAADACRVFATLLTQALDGAGKETLLRDPEVGPLSPEVARIAGGSFLTREPPEIRGTGYVVDALEAALWAFRSTDSFEGAVLAAVNLGDDADTTAAIVGQLAGAFYGVDQIPARWRAQLHLHDEIVALADALLELSEEPAFRSRPLDTRFSEDQVRLAEYALFPFVKAWNLSLNPEDLDLMAYAVMRQLLPDREATTGAYEEVARDVERLIAQHRRDAQALSAAMQAAIDRREET